MRIRSRQATSEKGRNLAKSLLQTAVLWTVFLAAIPFAINRLEQSLPGWLPTFDPGALRIIAIIVFALCALLGFWSGYLLVVLGSGTPLPLDCTHRLVVAGPYRVVRNPMVILGITQGAIVGIYLGSWTTILYSLLGALAWQLIARPWEHQDMLERFGEDYRTYAARVRCWIPCWPPYHPSRPS